MLGLLLRVRDYVFFERNPLVQILYFGAMGSCYYFYLREAHPLLPNEYVAWYHKWLATFLFVTSIAMYLVMSLSDPGVIRRDNMHEFEQYVSHPVMYPEGKYCRTCKTLKLPRSKHCRMCNHCVARFDHHHVAKVNCEVWFNGCVGEKNYKYFMLYLLVQLAVSLEGFYVTSSVFLVQVCNDLFHVRGVTMAEVGRTETAKILQSFIANNQALGFVTAMCLMSSVILWIFILMQLKRIARNETANETFKREDLREEADLDGETSGRRMFRFLFKRLNFRKRPKLSAPRRELKKTLDASWGGLFSPDSIMNTEESFSVDDVNFNPYKLDSFKENLLDALHLRGNNGNKKKTN
ncbi:Palmitoyltransferase [Phytophthora megakarya]|uniref:Palmitoyltransferase n=1 Tax=Phytophthora megakarya TaxID=4795 RepID=A0A225V4A5_9STRA|nr:Palmitoyltransferase [Phytophthora megakarya]